MILAGCLGCLGWLVVASGLGVLIGRAIRLADRRRPRPLGSEQWHPPEWLRHDTRPRSPTPRISRV